MDTATLSITVLEIWTWDIDIKGKYLGNIIMISNLPPALLCGNWSVGTCVQIWNIKIVLHNKKVDSIERGNGVVGDNL